MTARAAVRSLLADVPRRARATVTAPLPDFDSPRVGKAGEVLADSIVHEVAQPMQALSSVLREIQVLAKGSEVEKLAVEAGVCLDEVRPLLDELREAGQVHNGRRGERLRATYIRQVLASVAHRMSTSARAMNIALAFRSQDYWLRVDTNALRRIANILVSNAIKHSGAATVTVRVFSDGNGLLLAVKDDGAGIEPAKLQRLFDAPARERIENDWQARRGYGLYIVRLMLARMNGRLMVRSSSLGTTFFVHLPRPVIRDPKARAHAAMADGSMSGHMIVMLDDDPTALAASARLFETLGAQVMTFTESLDLLAACPKLPRSPSLFILDYRLRDGTCRRAVEALRFWLKDDFHCVVLTGDDAVSAALQDLEREVFVATKPLNDWALAHIQRFLRGEVALRTTTSERPAA